MKPIQALLPILVFITSCVGNNQNIAQKDSLEEPATTSVKKQLATASWANPILEFFNQAPERRPNQNLYVNVRPIYTRPIRKEQVIKAMTLNDLSAGFPTSWIEKYFSVEVVITNKGQVYKTKSDNDTLSAEQKSILQKSDINSTIVVNVQYQPNISPQYMNEISNIHFTISVVPDIEASYTGGEHEQYLYFIKNVSDKISEADANELQPGFVRFTIDEEGNVTNIQLKQKTGKTDIDQLLLEAIQNMPQWKAAKNADGTKLKQEFEFSIGERGC